MFDQSPEDELLPFCAKNNIAIIARVPFDEGSLTGNITPETEFPPNDFRNNYFRDDRKQEVYDRVMKIWNDVKDDTSSLAEAALRYLTSFPEVTTVIPGMRKEKNLISNVESVEKGNLSEELLKKLKRHRWERNYYL